MKEMEPLRRTGSVEERAMFESSPPPAISDTQRLAILRALEARLSPRGRRRWMRQLALALAGSLVAGSALAYGVSQMLSRSEAPPTRNRGPQAGLPVAMRAPAPPEPALPVPEPAERAPSPPAPPPQTFPAEKPTVRPPDPPPDPAPPPPPLGGPGLRSVADLWRLPSPDLDDQDLAPLEAPAPPALLFSRDGQREARLVLAGPRAEGKQRIVGRIRNVSVSLTVSDAEIFGRLGGHYVWLWLHGRRAQGTIAGWPVQFELARTNEGLALHGGNNLARSLPIFTRMLATSDKALSWFLGCKGQLAQISPGIYQGRCQRGDAVRLELPPAWQRLSPLARLILLSFSLPDPQPSSP